MKKWALLCFVVTIFSSFLFLQDDNRHLFYVPEKWPKPKYNFKNNILNSGKIELGRKLFYDPILSKDNTISCASCHSPYNAFAHSDHALSHGIRDQIGKRNAPALFNLAWQSVFMWDGSVHQLDVQALAPIHNPIEMDESLEHVIAKLKEDENYSKSFYKAFQDSSITGEHVLKSISAFLITLISANSKYDSVQIKKAKFTDQESRGYTIFKKNCSSCHPEPLFSTYGFENNGLSVDHTLQDGGRIRISNILTDSLTFKIPSLRNVEYSKPYMHDGRFKTLYQVIQHYTNPNSWNTQHSKKLNQDIHLTENEKVDLISFLLTLSDKRFIFNLYFSYPRK